MKIAFMYDVDGEMANNTVGVKYRRYCGWQPAICIEVPDNDEGGSYKVEGIPFPIVHYCNSTQDIWILNPGGDIPKPFPVTWENWEEIL